MDARRLGVGPHLPQAFLADAGIDYLAEIDYAQLTHDWAEEAFGELARLVHGKQAPLRPVAHRPRSRPPGSVPTPIAPALKVRAEFRLADYLEQHGHTSRGHLCPLASFWDAAHRQLTRPDDLNSLALAAEERHRLQ
ncbi:hypothetical protein ACFWB2_06795 [Streptomyces virginiae]|uniref:hypothetical protein n=1 Tax=Streptomyces virginiae TaxID=1961 RepID=UPI00364BDA3A